MPDWRFFRDREGNTYYIDQNGKIRIVSENSDTYQAVSALGIDYYIHCGIELIRDHRLPEGLAMLKSILALPVNNNRIQKAQVMAAKEIDRLRRNHGDRFTGLNREASLLLIKQNKGIKVIEDQMLYSFEVPEHSSVIRRKIRTSDGYRYTGLLVGITLSNESTDGKGKFDLLVAIDSERFSVPLKDIKSAEVKWKNNIGFDNLDRRKIFESGERIVYSFTNRTDPRLKGIEGIVLNRNISHFIRCVSPAENYESAKGVMERAVESFRVVDVRNSEGPR